MGRVSPSFAIDAASNVADESQLVFTGIIASINSTVSGELGKARESSPELAETYGIIAYSLPLCTNLMVSLLIVGRIWYMSREVTIYGLAKRSYTRKAANIIIESGMLYFAVQLVFAVLFGLNFVEQLFIVSIAVQTYVCIPSSNRNRTI